jgi:hypothetical protein
LASPQFLCEVSTATGRWAGRRRNCGSAEATVLPNRHCGAAASPGLMRPGHIADNSPATAAEVPNVWSDTTIPPYAFMCLPGGGGLNQRTGTALIFIFLKSRQIRDTNEAVFKIQTVWFTSSHQLRKSAFQMSIVSV